MAPQNPPDTDAPAGHPSQAEGEDPRDDEPADPKAPGHPSQAEGDDPRAAAPDRAVLPDDADA